MSYMSCEDCQLVGKCPCGYSYGNAACLTIREAIKQKVFVGDEEWQLIGKWTDVDGIKHIELVPLKDADCFLTQGWF